MEAGNLLRFIPLNQPPQQLLLHFPRFSSFPRTVTVNASQGLKGYRGPKPRREWIADWVSNNDDLVRSIPIYVGGLSLLAVLFNRTVSGIAPVADASSSQSRADLLTLGLAVTNILNGLVWLSIRPKSISVVNPNGVECQRIASHLPDFVISELLWAWNSLSDVTCCRSLVIAYDRKCILQIGFAAASLSNGSDPVAVDTNKLVEGSLYQGVLKSASQSYLANLSLYPGKSELPFLPSNTQVVLILSFFPSGSTLCLVSPRSTISAVLKDVYFLPLSKPNEHSSFQKIVAPFKAVILQPLGDKGIAIIGGDTIRGFTSSDQAWITLIGEKLDATLTKVI